ncbi:MAG: hypothetical protein Q8P85_10540 [Pseudomonas sp.]|nr:hypothetical protein [Pseudomonas sp.]
MKLRYLLYLGLVLPLAACTLHVDGGRGYAPPPYAAPAQVEWRWDPALDVFVVLGGPHLYYRDRIYYRWHDHDGWYWSDRHDGGWRQGGKRLPPGLSKKYGKSRRSSGGGGY